MDRQIDSVERLDYTALRRSKGHARARNAQQLSLRSKVNVPMQTPTQALHFDRMQQHLFIFI